MFFQDFGPNPGPGRLPLDSGRRDVEFTGVFVSVASVAINFVSDAYFGTLSEKQIKVCPSNGGRFPVAKMLPFPGCGRLPGIILDNQPQCVGVVS